MGLILQSAIDTAVHILNDEGHVTYTEAELLKYANDALDALVGIAPQYFYACGEITCTAGRCLQSVNFANVHALVSINRVKDGNMVLLMEKVALDRFNPYWCNDPPGPAKNWARHLDSPVMFYLYPPAPEGQVLQITYIRTPDEYTATQDVGLPDTFAPIITDYIVGTAMSKDDEHINAGRAQAFLNSFVAKAKEM